MLLEAIIEFFFWLVTKTLIYQFVFVWGCEQMHYNNGLVQMLNLLLFERLGLSSLCM